ncbi:MAG: hypothetical protein RJA36_3785 [Pseudomonadota bacterium]|jgi:hypothetical protein
MHDAPSVEYPAGRSAFQARLEALLVLAWLLMQAGWAGALEGRVLPGAWWFSALAGLLAWLAARWRARHAVEGTLCWQAAPAGAHGQPGRWIWRSADYRQGTELSALAWSLDLQAHVLLYLRDRAGLGCWVWLEQRSAPEAWDDLRRALVAWRDAGGRTGC